MTADDSSRQPAWKYLIELEALFLILLVSATYLTRISTLPLRGEESRRAVVAVEMMNVGNWIVPRFQGEAIFMSSRPPFQAWAIAFMGYLRGGVDVTAVRLPSCLALMTIVLMLYFYCRPFLGKAGAFGAGAAYATMAQVLELGRLGETDLLFTLWVSASLLCWHAGFSLGWRPVWTWVLAYTFVTLGTLTKGVQAPVYFAASVGTYLLWTGRWRFAVSGSHLTGICYFIFLLGCWQVPFFIEAGAAGVRHIYWGDVSMYGNDRSLQKLLPHLIKYPAELLCGCLLPWSFMLLAYCFRSLRERLGAASDRVAFCLCCILTSLPSVWFMTNAKARFYMPLYPCFAVLIGIAIQRCLESASGTVLNRVWKNYLALSTAAIAGFGIAVLTTSLIQVTWLQQSIGTAIAFTAFAIVCSAAVWRFRRSESVIQGEYGIATIAIFLGTTFVVISTNAMSRSSIDKEAQMAELKSRLPEDIKMYSLGMADHALLYYYGKPIQMWDMSADTIPDDLEYFCFRLMDYPQPETLPFKWELVGAVACGRNRFENELSSLSVVGRRTSIGENPNARQTVQHYENTFATALR